MEIEQQQLKKGMSFFFQTKDDDFREAELCFRPSFSSSQFFIHFNGAIIHSSKTFDAMIKRFEKLKTKWNLHFDRIES